MYKRQGFKREFSKLIGFLVVALIAVGLVLESSYCSQKTEPPRRGHSEGNFYTASRETVTKSMILQLGNIKFLLLEAVAKEENIQVTSEEVDEQIGKIAESYGIEKEKALEIFKEDDRKNVEGDLLVQKAAKVLEDSAVEVEPAKTEA